MRSLSRAALAASFPLVLLTGIAYAQPTLVAGLGLGWWGAAARGPSIRDEQQREEELERKDELVVRRMAAKQRVIAELLGGRLTLLEAAVWFRHLNDGAVPIRHENLRGLGGRSEGERLCRQVLSWAQGEMKAYPESQARAAYGRLEAELEAELARGRGTVELPDGGR